jgi:hemerythrin superfamily protein
LAITKQEEIMPSATQLIKRDHKKVEGLFEKFDKAKNSGAKQRVCEQVIEELEVHAKIEEEIFYPAVRKHLGEEELLEDAKQEHQQAKQIMAELKKANPEDEEFDSKFAELVECIQHHVEEEEGELLPKVEQSDMDLQGYGEEIADRKEELLKQTSKSGTSQKKAGGRKAKSGGRGRRRSGRAA